MSEREVRGDFDYILSKIVGGAGLAQWIISFSLWPIVFASAYPLIIHLFTAYAPRNSNVISEIHEVKTDLFWPLSKRSL